ncbi:MAG: hypothetical protein QOJ39_2240 [Candidatus Eremiobacteraeota bacterium]|nr:hypothetical protein [Candidatus Eremiobacteraeota bacterium]
MKVVMTLLVRDESIAWHDQEALIWAIQSIGLEHRVLESPMWNLSVDRVAAAPEARVWNGGLADRLREALPDGSSIGTAARLRGRRDASAAAAV